MAEVRRWGDEETVGERCRKGDWSGLATSEDARPQASKGDAVQLAVTTPTRCGPRKRWRDVVRKYLRNVEVGEHEFLGKRGRVTAAFQQDRTDIMSVLYRCVVCMCVHVCVCVCVCVCVRA